MGDDSERISVLHATWFIVLMAGAGGIVILILLVAIFANRCVKSIKLSRTRSSKSLKFMLILLLAQKLIK